MSTITVIDASHLRREIAAGSIAQLWNVLTDDYFGGELIPGSRRVPLDQLGREIARLEIPKDTSIAVYCSGVTCPQSGAAAEKLAALGFTNVLQFEGGLEAWKEAGLPVERVG